MPGELDQFKDGKLYMEVYQRRENLRFFGNKEAAASEEDTREILVDFLKQSLVWRTPMNSNFKGCIGLESGGPPTESLDRL